MNYDVAVVGLGGIGSAILAHCARRGAAAIGLEQFQRGHELGASSGKSRMIRKAYFEDSAYVPLVLRAYELWHELERDAGAELMHQTGVLAVGTEESQIIRGIKRAAREHALRLETLGQEEVVRRYPHLKLLPDETAVFEPNGAVLEPERATAAHLACAESAGAELSFENEMVAWEPVQDGVLLRLADGRRITARTVVLALGPWFQAALGSVGISLRLQRNVQVWFAPKIAGYAAPEFPAFLLDRAGLPAPLYGFPDFGDGLKAAFHGSGDFTDPQKLDREIEIARDVQPLVAAMEQWMPGAAGSVLSAKPCLYALTRDEHFVLGQHPDHPSVILCGGFSGHGFKFAPVIGEIAADLALDGGTRHQIEFLSPNRFRNGGSPADATNA